MESSTVTPKSGSTPRSPRIVAKRQRVREELIRAEQASVLRNDDAVYTFKVITRTAVPLLKIYADHPGSARLYRESVLALLSKGPNIDGE